jgi:ATP-dependent helicase/nuclease subunit B
VSVTLLPRGSDLIRAVAEPLRPEGRDYSRNWVVFPEQRPGHYLRRALAEREGRGFIPPRVDSVDTFVDRVYEEHLGRRDRRIDALDAVALLFDLHRSAPDRLGREGFLSADHFFPLGIKLWNDLEELTAAGLAPDEILSKEALVQENAPAQTLARLQSLAFFYERFYALLRERGDSTRSSRYRDVAAGIRREQFPATRRFLFAGFFSLTKTETALLKALLTWDDFSLFLVEGNGIETLLETLGLDAEELRKGAGAAAGPGPSPAVPRPAFEFFKCPDTHGQVFALNKALEDGLRDPRLLNERRVIVLPASETLFPLYQQTLSLLDERKDFNISLGYPLARTPVYSFFHNLLELVQALDEEGRVYIPAYLRFVLHPYTKNLFFPGPDQRSDLTRILFHALEEGFARRKTRAFWSLDELEADPGIRETVQELSRGVEGAPDVEAFLDHLRGIHARTIAPFLVIRDVGDFARKLIGVLDFVYQNGTARQHHFFHPYAEAFRDQLDRLARSLLRGIAFADRTSYLHLFQRVMAGGTVPFFGTPLGGLQVLGFWETRGIPFEEVNILDMNEEVIPAFGKADSLLPLAARKALGLPTYIDLERRMEYALDGLVAGARRVRFFFIENADKEKSRFLEKLLWEGEKAGRRAADVRTVRYEVALQTDRPRPVPKTPGIVAALERASISATALDQYLACPLQFYYDHVLGLREKEEVGEDMEKKDLGTLVHGILEDYFRPLVGRRLRPSDLDPGRLEGAIEARFTREFGRDLSGSAYLMKLQTRTHLADFLDRYQASVVKSLAGPRRAGLKILSLEQRIDRDRSVGRRTFHLAGKVDRTEERDGALWVLDYKTAWNQAYYDIRFDKLDLDRRATWNQAVASLQLPFYTLLLSGVHGRPSADIHCAFLMLGQCRLGPKIEFSPYEAEDESERRGRVETMERLIDRLLLEIADIDVPFDPALASERACRWCSYAVLCNRIP